MSIGAGRLIFVVPVLAFAALAVYLAVGIGSGRDPTLIPSALIDKPAPVFDLPPLIDGQPGFTGHALLGKPSLVNVFASWCVPCRAEHPLLLGLAEQGKIAIYGLDWKDKRPAAQAYIAELGNPYALIGADESGRVGIDWGVYGVPETYLVDRAGRIRYKHVGPLTQTAIDNEILPLLAELGR